MSFYLFLRIISRISLSKVLNLKPGINVMDLSPWYTNDTIQMVVIRACMEEILNSGEYTAIGIPEAWKNLPQGEIHL